MPIFGHMVGTIGPSMGDAKTWKRYAVPAGVRHSALAKTNCMFINFERWTSEPTSAADDFTAV